MENIYTILKELHIPYEIYNHPAVFTVAEAEEYDMQIPAAATKNLFLRNKKGTKYYLVVIQSHKKADLKKIASMLDESKLSFATPERLMEHLGLTPGSVSPFGLINDKEHQVKAVIDSDILIDGKVAFHPNINTATVVLSNEDFKKYLTWTTNPCVYLSL